MLTHLFIKGLIIGFSVAAIVGPIGILCIQRTMSYGLLSGFAVGLGAALADATFGSIAALGLTTVSACLLAYKVPLQLAGALFLFYLGFKAFRQQSINLATSTMPTQFFKSVSSTFFLTMTNPVTIITFLGIFAGAGLIVEDASALAGMIMVLGVFLGSFMWFFGLTTMVSMIRTALKPRHMIIINRCSGLLLIGFCIYCLFDLFH